MGTESNPAIETAVVSALVDEPDSTAAEVAALVGCTADEVRRTTFFKRVFLSRFARDPDATVNLWPRAADANLIGAT